jgi:hypothetical protein
MSVIAYHLIWTNYGIWLANDLRGSGSKTTYTPALANLGDVHFGRKKLQPARNKVHAFYERAEPLLKCDVIRFNDEQCHDIAQIFDGIVRTHRYTCYACVIMPDHVHFVIRKHRDQAEDMIDIFQEESRMKLLQKSMVPEGHPV